jgi:beta-galactosidase
MYWNWHSIHNSFESYWKGILSHDLQPHATYRELAAFGKEVRNIEEHLLNLKKNCKAAIVVNNESLTGLEEFPISEEFGYNHVVRWMYDACYEINLECDILSVKDDFTDYALLFVPALYSASDETIAKLKEYTNQGGHMILGFKSGFSDDELKIYHDLQPHGLTECIGASYDQFTRPVNVALQFAEETENYNVSEWMELVCADTAEIWAAYVHPYWSKYAAITHNTYGKGTATYIGCYMEKSGLKALIRRICKAADIALPDYKFPIIHKTGINALNKTVHYYFNYSSEGRSFIYDGQAGYNLLDNQQVASHNNCMLNPWNLMIIEEN